MSIKQSGTFKNPHTAQVFVDEPGHFLPLVYYAKKYTQIPEKHKNHYRHPIIGSPKHLGGGMSGKVEAIEIAPGHFCYSEGNFNRKPIQLAQKSFREPR